MKVKEKLRNGMEKNKPEINQVEKSYCHPDLSPLTSGYGLKEEVFRRQLFFDQVAEKWDENYLGADEVMELIKIVNRFHLNPGELVMDAGCGTGILTPFILKEIGPRGWLFGVDISGKMVEIARKKYQAPNLVFFKADIYHLEIENFFDRIICFRLFPHLPNKRLALKKFRHYLKPSGELIIAHTAGQEEVNNYHARLAEPICYDRLPKDNEMKTMIRAAGFNLLELQEKDNYFLRAKRNESPFEL